MRSIVVRNGYQKSNDIFQQEQPRAPVAGGVLARRDPDADAAGSNRLGTALTLPKPVKAYWVKFIIDDVWAGNKYTDTAITKLVVNSERVQ